MKPSPTLKRTFLFGILILVAAALLGRSVAHGYLHPADPLILLAAIYLPTPAALAAVGVASVAADLLKGYYLLAPVTLVIKLLMVWATKKLLKLPLAKKSPEIAVLPALLIPVPGFFLAELIFRLCIGMGAAAFGSTAAVTLKADLVQAAAGMLIFLLLYALINGIRTAREEVRRQKEARQQAEEQEESTDENA